MGLFKENKLGLFNGGDELYCKKLLIEKRIAPTYICENGIEVWVDRYGATYYPNMLRFKGANFFEAGYIYAPYIHTTEIPIALGVIGVSSRGTGTLFEKYSTITVNPKFYGHISFGAVSTAHTFTNMASIDPL